MQTVIKCALLQRRIALALRICLTRTLQYTRLPLNPYRTRFLLFIRRCCRGFRFVMYWRMTLVPVKQS